MDTSKHICSTHHVGGSPANANTLLVLPSYAPSSIAILCIKTLLPVPNVAMSKHSEGMHGTKHSKQSKTIRIQSILPISHRSLLEKTQYARHNPPSLFIATTRYIKNKCCRSTPHQSYVGKSVPIAADHIPLRMEGYTRKCQANKSLSRCAAYSLEEKISSFSTPKPLLTPILNLLP